MNRTAAIVLALLLATAGTFALEAQNDAELGLSKESVFSTPHPIVAQDAGGEPGENALLTAYFAEGIPPMIPHAVEEMLPIRLDDNLCMDCHALPEAIGETMAEGDPTPIPASHYVDLRRDPQTVGEEVVGARWVCVQCHAPQADTPPLLANTYRP